ncbi:MAG: hypothetical protein P8Z31_07830 [Gammaproteobacteria bacterium]
MHLARPWQLEHAYTQGMMLGLLLHKDIRSALVLGLGGGSIVRALRHARPKLRIDAVDYRMAVIRLAQDYFELAPDSALRLHCDEAERFIEHDRSNHDLIFTDLYLAQGAHEAQQSTAFLASCRERLSEKGVLMINRWRGTQQESDIARQAISDAFGDRVLNLHIDGGNQISFCFNGELPMIDHRRFFADAQKLGLQLGIPLQRLARSFWRQNAAVLQLRRFPVRE